jgi:hypothetical protein
VGSGRARVQVTTRSRKSGVVGSDTQGQEVGLVSRVDLGSVARGADLGILLLRLRLLGLVLHGLRLLGLVLHGLHLRGLLLRGLQLP